ncbi:MAG: hypothetical protein KAH38_01385, partial [Candidatus Hydrogenedentes bacterium]|nr:hypothetical protein [Candidatus Hydrogenedentota bacterium]
SENDSIVKVPVKLRGEIIGNFKIHTNNDKAEIPASDMELIEAIAERAAIAMENARLLEDSQRRANTERTIANISTKISGAADFNSIIQTTLKELQRNLGGSRLSVQFSEETNEKDSEQ